MAGLWYALDLGFTFHDADDQAREVSEREERVKWYRDRVLEVENTTKEGVFAFAPPEADLTVQSRQRLSCREVRWRKDGTPCIKLYRRISC